MRQPATIHRHKMELDLKAWKHRSPEESDYHELVTEPSLVYDADTNDLEFVFLLVDDDTSDIEAALQRIRFDPSTRATGMRTTSRIFGNQPRSLPRRDFCTAASLATEDPETHRTIARYADRVANYYKNYSPALFAHHERQTRKVRDEWRMEDSVFTSGIVNKNNPLLYHFDAGNYQQVWSNMLVFKHHSAGGFLAVPEYDLAFALPNKSLLMFDGQRAMHGVTPIRQTEDDGYRYSVVFYSLKQMWSCLPIDDEVIRARQRRDQRERRRAGRL